MSIKFSAIERILDAHKNQGSLENYNEIYLSRLLQFTSNALLKHLNTAYKIDNLDDKLFLVLMAINSHYPQGVKPSTLSEITHFSRVQISRHIDILVNKNWVARKQNTQDRRSQYVILTTEGRYFLQKTLPPLQDKIVNAWGIISPLEQQQLRSILTKLLTHIAEANE